MTVSYDAPRSLAEALRRLEDDPELMPLAGCTDLMVADPLRRAGTSKVLDLLRVPELRGIRPVTGGLEIGATTTFAEIRNAPEVRQAYPALAEAAGCIGGWQIQNRATLGGNLANASPAGDSLPVLLALGAVVICAHGRGRREVPCEEFFLSYRKTALQRGEIIAAVRLPDPGAGSEQRFRKVGARAAQAIAKVVVALATRIEDGAIVEPRLAAGSVAPIPIRLRRTEEALRGRVVGAEAADLAGRLAAEEVSPIDDVRSTAAYRRHALGRIVRRMVLSLVPRDQEGL